MKRTVIITIIIVMLIGVQGCSTDKKTDYYSQINEYIKQNDSIGAEFPRFYHIGDKYAVAASYFGMFIFDTEIAEIDAYVDLKQYDCNYFQGDKKTIIKVDNEEKKLYFYNIENDEINGQIYVLDLNSKEIYKAGIDARNAEYYEGFTEEQDFFAVLDNAGESIKSALNKYITSENGCVYKHDNMIIFAVADEWRISNLKFVFLNTDTGEVKELPIMAR